MDYFDIVHNDLHFENVFIHELETPIVLRFTIPLTMQTISMETKYIVKFFDWDRACVKSLGNNPILSENINVSYHQINKARTKQDFYQFLCGLSQFEILWHNIIHLGIFGNIPRQTKDYIFNPADTVQKISLNFLNVEMEKFINDNESDVIISPRDNIIYIEIDKDKFEKMFPPDQYRILKYIKDLIKSEHYTIANRLYFGLQLFSSSGNIISKKPIEDIDKINLIILKGHYCQSLYDTDDVIIPPPIHFIETPKFNNFFNRSISTPSLIIFEYTFPISTSSIV